MDISNLTFKYGFNYSGKSYRWKDGYLLRLPYSNGSRCYDAIWLTPVLAAVASTNVHSRHEPFFLKTFLGRVFYFSFSCVYQIHYVYLHRNNLTTKKKSKWKQQK